jgi:hypothetical protein
VKDPGFFCQPWAPGTSQIHKLKGVLRSRTRACQTQRVASARAGGRTYKMTQANAHLDAAAMGHKETKGSLWEQRRIPWQALYSYVSPTGELRPDHEEP